jgi:hypothetical protein
VFGVYILSLLDYLLEPVLFIRLERRFWELVMAWGNLHQGPIPPRRVSAPVLPTCGGPERCGIAVLNIPEPPPVPVRVFTNPFVEMPPLPSTPSGINTESTVWDDDLIEE